MKATRAPVISRWASILLRRTLLSEVNTPANVNGADWAAERAWLLLRMGEARSEEHTSELQSLMRIAYAVFCLKKKKHSTTSSSIISYRSLILTPYPRLFK